jgi:hypothetical protein
MAGYSSTPLWKKLGYKSDLRVFLDSAPAEYAALLHLPKGTNIIWLERSEVGMPFAHVFSKTAAELARKLRDLKRKIATDGVIWISWPKKSSGVQTDITEDTIRTLALPLGFVDIKVCAVDHVWSGLKLMIRKSERETFHS